MLLIAASYNETDISWLSDDPALSFCYSHNFDANTLVVKQQARCLSWSHLKRDSSEDRGFCKSQHGQSQTGAQFHALHTVNVPSTRSMQIDASPQHLMCSTLALLSHNDFIFADVANAECTAVQYSIGVCYWRQC